MKHQSKLSQEQQQSRQVGNEQQTQSPATREFANADELLRYDAANTPVPPEIARRLQESAGNLPQPRAPWWKRWLGGTRS
jgi:hypothetical protein